MEWLGVLPIEGRSTEVVQRGKAGLATAVAYFAGTRLFDRRGLPTAAVGFVFVFNPVLFCWAASGMAS